MISARMLPVFPRSPTPATGMRSPSGGAAGFDVERRLTWFMLLRAGVITLLLGAAVVSWLATTIEHDGTWQGFEFALIGLGYALSLLWAVLLHRGKSPVLLAALLVGCDAVLATVLIHSDGYADSGFVALDLMLIVGATMTLSRNGALIATAAISLAYLLDVIGLRVGLFPLLMAPTVSSPSTAGFVFVVGKNLMLFAASFALARRLAGEVEEAGARIAAQGARLDELAALYTDVVRSMTSGLLTVDDEGRVRSLNPAGEEILGLSSTDIVGRPLAEQLPELAEALRGYIPKQRREAVVVHTDGDRRVVGLSVADVVSASGRRAGRMVNFQDLTVLRGMQEQVERAERLAAIGRLAAGIAHEIRNPLAAMSGSIELLTPSVSHDPDSQELIAILTREAERLNRLITDLLDFARPRPPSVAPLEVGTTLREILRVVENDRRLNPYANRFVLEFGEPVWVDADPGQLRQVVLNLLLNAADATPGGEPVELRAREDGDRAVIEVRDHGPGIPAEVRARIFEPFYTTKKGGTGLGLPTVHRIVEEHHGTIEVDQPEDGGTVFRVLLPRRAPVES